MYNVLISAMYVIKYLNKIVAPHGVLNEPTHSGRQFVTHLVAEQFVAGIGRHIWRSVHVTFYNKTLFYTW